ncbi:MAG: S1 RNA-binding domain-containing protein [Lachnospiraceae bacterium]
MELGKKQRLLVVKKVEFGIYLAERETDDTRVLLPAKQVPEGTKIGDCLEVFLYKDSKDRLIATTAEPKIMLDGLAVLRVLSIGKIGAFLDWGLEKDLFLPFKEMTKKVEEGDEILVTLYIDKSRRLCASMKGIYHILRTDSEYQKGDTVQGRVYEFSDNFGTFVAVDDQFSAMLPRSEDTSFLRIGDVIEARVTHVKEDGKLDLTMRKAAYLQMDDDAKKVLEVIDAYAGVLPFNDKASPEVIKRETQLSKNAFKRAVGHLYKERLITFTEKGIRRTTEEEQKKDLQKTRKKVR